MRFMQISMFAAISSVLTLQGCAVGPDYARPAVSLPAQYTEHMTEATTQAMPVTHAWWKIFKDPVLDDLIDKALRNNADVQLAAARIEEADATMREAGAAYFPEIDLGGSGSRSRISTTTATPLPSSASIIRNNFKLGLSTAFELDFWGKLRRTGEAARAQALASHYGKDTVELTLIGLVTDNYLTLRALDAQLAVSESSLTSRNESLTVAQNRLQAGIASQLDVQQATGAQATLLAQIANLQQQRALAQHQLAFLTATPELQLPKGDIRQLPVPPVPPAGLPSSILDARPDVRQAEAQLIAANAKIGVVKAALFPSISLTGNLGGESQELSDLFLAGSRIWSAGLSLNLPIFDAGKLSARVDQASAQQKQSLASYQKAIQNAFKEVNDALVTVRQTTAGEQAYAARMQAAQKSMMLADVRYKAGYSPYLETLDAQRTVNDATLSFIQNRQTRLSASVQLFKALGGGWYESQPEQ